MLALERHDNEIKLTIIRIQKAIDKNCWMTVYDLTKHLLKLVRERNEYSRLKGKTELQSGGGR